MITIIIPGRFPGLNEYVKACRSGAYVGSSMINKSEKVIIEAIWGQYKDILIPPVTLCYTYYEPNKRRDKDNVSGFFHKVFQDSLVKAGLLENDGWDYIEGFHDYFEVDKREPRIEVKIIEGGD